MLRAYLRILHLQINKNTKALEQEMLKHGKGFILR